MRVAILLVGLLIGCGSWKAPPTVPTEGAINRRALMHAYPAAERFLQTFVSGDEGAIRAQSVGLELPSLPPPKGDSTRYTPSLGRMHVEISLKTVTFEGQLWTSTQTGGVADQRPFNITLERGEAPTDWTVSRFVFVEQAKK